MKHTRCENEHRDRCLNDDCQCECHHVEQEPIISYKHTPEAKLEYAPCWHVYDIADDDRFIKLVTVLTGMSALKVVCCWCGDNDILLDSWEPDTTPREHGEFAPGVTVA